MKLHFQSEILSNTDRYSSAFSLPDFLYDEKGNFDREATIKLLLDEEYGHISEGELTVTVEPEAPIRRAHYAGSCKTHERLRFKVTKGERSASFPVDLYLPAEAGTCPMVVALDFSIDETRCYIPFEEIMEAGVGVARVHYIDVTSDDNDFENGVAPLLSDRSDPHSAGKLRIWAWAASQVATYLLENGLVAEGELYVTGHSRLGKTALLTAALDTRFAGVHSNNSGCCGVAISREKGGETVERICRVFPYWFAPHFASYSNREAEMPFDQHYLTALVAPRKLSVATAEEDTWADTDAQYLSLEAASVIYEKMGVMGLDPDRGHMTTGCSTAKGQIGLTMRAGRHYFSRRDWLFFLSFLRRK